MDPQEWQQRADELAAEMTEALDALERDFWPEPSDPSFRSFWPRVRDLNERLRTAPAIDVEVKLALQARIREISRRAREQQELYFEATRARKAELLQQIEDIRERAAAAVAGRSAHAPQQLRHIRQDLTALRDSIATVDLPGREDRQDIWARWQEVNQESWERLNELWSENERMLQGMLDEAKGKLDAGDVRGTREVIKRFNATAREREASHKSLRTLRTRANTIWRETGEVAQAKHDAYMSTIDQRVEQWKTIHGRNDRAIAKLRAEVSELQARGAETGVAAAFARAMIEDKLREIARLEETNESLDGRIESAETTLTPVS